MTKTKSDNVHILWNPNKNYLGHWDIASGNDLVLTIQKITWVDVKNPVTGDSQNKRVVYFVEDVKPLICNEENANAIFKVCGTELIKDYEGKGFKIKLYTIHGKWFGEESQAVRVRDKAPKEKVVLNEKHPKWADAIKSVKEGNIDLDGLRDHFVVSDDTFKKMQE